MIRVRGLTQRRCGETGLTADATSTVYSGHGIIRCLRKIIVREPNLRLSVRVVWFSRD